MAARPDRAALDWLFPKERVFAIDPFAEGGGDRRMTPFADLA